MHTGDNNSSRAYYLYHDILVERREIKILPPLERNYYGTYYNFLNLDRKYPLDLKETMRGDVTFAWTTSRWPLKHPHETYQGLKRVLSEGLIPATCHPSGNKKKKKNEKLALTSGGKTYDPWHDFTFLQG